jgi:serine/threonine protein kinase
MPPETATEKLGRYEILSELGQGAMGVVYKAIDPLIDRVVAIKTIKFEGSREDCAQFEERFYREAKSAGRLNHPHIVTIYDVGKSDSTAYIAMEYLQGRQLKDILDVHTAMPVDTIVDIAAQIAEGLAYAHKNGIVHRDIKPANIMLVQGDKVKITDFGIARMSSSTGTLAGTVLGSPRYMAPEQVIGKVVDGRSDIFSLGVVLYEMLTGESPFDGDNINTTMYRIVNEAPVPPKTLVPRIPEVFDYIVAKALAKHPDARYQSADEMAHALRNYKALSVPSAGLTTLYHPITVDRRTQSKSPVGEATLILAPGVSAAPREEPSQPERDVAPASFAEFPATGRHSDHKKLFLSISLVLLVIAAGVMWTKSGPSQKNKLATQSDTLPENTVQIEVVLNKPSPPKALLPRPHLSLPVIEPSPLTVSSTPSVAPPPSTNALRAPTTSVKTLLPKGHAQLSFAITPWGDVYLDGKKMGASPPLKELKVPAGTHTIEIRNVNFPPYKQTLLLKADSSKKLKHIFK